MNEHRRNGIRSVVPCPDPARSPRGAWLLDARIWLESSIAGMISQDSHLTPSSCFQQLGALWDDDWFDRIERAGWNSPSWCRDATRAMGGAWILPLEVPVETLIPAMKSEDCSRSTADCFRLLGGGWHETFESRRWTRDRDSEEDIMQHFFLDPVKTSRERFDRVDDDTVHRTGVDYLGAWGMTMKQKAAADRLKEVHPDWDWSQCYATVGGSWNMREYRDVLARGTTI